MGTVMAMAPPHKTPTRGVVRDVALLVLGASAVALATNAVRRDGISLIATEPYEILVPCPVPTAEVTPLEPSALGHVSPTTAVLIDARTADSFQRWHAPAAVNVPFDYLEPTAAEVIERIAASAAHRVVVYGDGDDPDSGEQLAREIAAQGLRNVFYVRGGAPALGAPRQTESGER